MKKYFVTPTFKPELTDGQIVKKTGDINLVNAIQYDMKYFPTVQLDWRE
jgi:hypothetical protein